MRIAEKILEYSSKTQKTSSDGKGPHFHHYRIDLAGNGNTTFTSEGDDNHGHKIEDFEVMPCQKDGHTHTINKNESSQSHDIPVFKTEYGFKHWVEMLKKSRKEHKSGVTVNGKTFSSVKDALNQFNGRKQ
jgi:hypothetical protein